MRQALTTSSHPATDGVAKRNVQSFKVKLNNPLEIFIEKIRMGKIMVTVVL